MMRWFILLTLLGSTQAIVDVLRIAINSPDGHRWLANPLPDDGCVIHLKAKGSRDLVITFSPEKAYVQEIYQVVIGADNNQKVCIRKIKGTKCQVENSYPDIVTGNLQDIWIAYKPSTYLFIGVWALVGGKIQQLAVYNDLSPLSSPLSGDDCYIGVTSLVATSEWLFTPNESCGITEVEEADGGTDDGGDSPGSGQANRPSNNKGNPVSGPAGNSHDNQVDHLSDDGRGKSGSKRGRGPTDSSGDNQGDTGRGHEDRSSSNTSSGGSAPNNGPGNDSRESASDSTSEFFEYEFSGDGDASWQFIPTAIKMTPIFIPFALKGSGDAYLRLSSAPNENTADYYELIIGNKVVRVNRGEQQVKQQQYEESVLNDNELVNFIIKFHGSSLLLYKEGVLLTQYVDDEPLGGLRFIGVNSYTSNGEVPSSWNFLKRFFEDVP